MSGLGGVGGGVSGGKTLDVTFKNDNQYFKNLVNKAKELSKDGLTPQEITQLQTLANSDNTLTKDEKLFIEALKNNDNVKKIQEADFNPAQFTLKMNESSVPGPSDYKVKRDGSGDNPLSAQIDDVGISRFNTDMKSKSIDDFKKDISENPKLKASPELKEKVDNFIAKLPNDKEAMLYLREALNRVPAIDNKQLGNIMDKLGTMLNRDYDSRIGNVRDLVVAGLHDVAAPQDIDQENIGTCAGTCVQIQLALKNPNEYLNMLDTLSQNKKYLSLSGQVIPPNWTFDGESTGKQSNRTISCKVMQNAIMDYSDGSERNYDSSKGDDGLTNTQTNKGLQAFLNADLVTYESGQYTPDQLAQVLKDSHPSKENPTQVSLSFSSSGRDARHAVNVIGIEGNNVKIINPWGREETFSMDKLKARMYSVIAPPKSDANVARIPDKTLASEIDKQDSHWYSSTDGAALLINNSNDTKRKELLDALTLDQKVKLIKSLNSGSVDDQDKTAMLRIMENLLQGGDEQNHGALRKLSAQLDNKLGSFVTSMNNHSPLFYDIATKVYEFNKSSSLMTSLMDDRITAVQMANYKLSDELAAHAVGGLDGDTIANSPDVAAKLLQKAYNHVSSLPNNTEDEKKTRTAFLNNLKQFQKGVVADWDTGDTVREMNKLDPKLREKIESLTGLKFDND